MWCVGICVGVCTCMCTYVDVCVVHLISLIRASQSFVSVF